MHTKQVCLEIQQGFFQNLFSTDKKIFKSERISTTCSASIKINSWWRIEIQPEMKTKQTGTINWCYICSFAFHHKALHAYLVCLGPSAILKQMFLKLFMEHCLTKLKLTRGIFSDADEWLATIWIRFELTHASVLWCSCTNPCYGKHLGPISWLCFS